MNAKPIFAAIILAIAATALAAPTVERLNGSTVQRSNDAAPPHICLADKAAPMSTDTNHWWWKAHEYRLNQVKEAKAAGGTVDVLLLGDAILHDWELKENQKCWKRTFSGEGESTYRGLNLAIEGDRTETLFWRVENGLFKGAPLPRAVILLVGTNNTGTRNAEEETPDDTAAGVKAVVEAVRKRTDNCTKIIVFGLLPRGTGTNDAATVRNRLVNERLRKLDESERKTGPRVVFYRDIGDLFLKRDGTIDTGLLGDRLHPSKKGYDLLAREFTAALDEVFASLSPTEVSRYWSNRAWNAYRNLDPGTIRRAKAEIDKVGGNYFNYATTWLDAIKMWDDYDRFPRAEEDIVFPKTLADLGFRDTKVVHANNKAFAGGWNPTNCTAAIQAAIDSDSTTVVIDKAPGPWYITGIRLKSCMRLVVKKGAKLMMDKYAPHKTLIWGANIKDVIIEGEGSAPGESLVAGYASYDERKVWCKDYGHSIVCLQQTENVVIRNIRLAESEEDGVVFGSVGGGGRPCLNTYLDNVVLDSHYRQAMSICSGDGVFCRNVSFINTRGNAPSAGIDFEPPYEVTPNTGVYLFDCTFKNNAGGGLMFATSTFAPMTVYAKRTRFLRHRSPQIDFLPRLGIYMAAQKRIPSKFIFEDCDFETYQDMPMIQGSCGPMFTYTLRNCRMKSLPIKGNPRRKYLASPIMFVLNRDFGPKGLPDHMVGVGTFENVTWEGPEGVPPIAMCDELCRLDIKGALKGEIVMNGKRCVLDGYEYTAEDVFGRVAPEVPVDLKTFLPPAAATEGGPPSASRTPQAAGGPGSVPAAYTPCRVAWDGAWWMAQPVYSYLFHAKKGGKVSFAVTYPAWRKNVIGKPVEIEGADGANTEIGTYTNGTGRFAFTVPSDGWYRLTPPFQGPATVSDFTGAVPAYQGDTKNLFLTKFFPREGTNEYTAYFEVPAGGRECRIRMTWGSVELRDPAGNIVERVKQGEYLGNHVFRIKPSSDKAEIWSLRCRDSIVVLRFYEPLTGVWADSPEDLPCQFAEHFVPAKAVQSSQFSVQSSGGPGSVPAATVKPSNCQTIQPSTGGPGSVPAAAATEGGPPSVTANPSTLQPFNSSTSQSGSAFPADPDWGDPLPPFDEKAARIDRSTLTAEKIAALDKAVAARKAFGEKTEWAERYAKERKMLDDLAKKAHSDGERHDVEMGELNIPPLQRMAAMEARAAKETDVVRELAAYCEMKMRVIAEDDDDLERELRVLHLGLIRGTTLEYSDPVLLLALRDLIAERQKSRNARRSR